MRILQIRKFIRKLKISFAEYKITIMGIALLTIYGAASSMLPYGYEPSFFLDESAVYDVLLLFCVASLFVETYFAGNKKAKIFGFAAAALAAAGFTFFLGLDGTVQFANVSGARLSQAAGRFMGGYILLLLGAAVYCCFKKSGMRFEKYALKVFANMFQNFIVYFILIIGVTIIIGIFSILFLEDSSFYLDSAGSILVTGLYLAPNCIVALNDTKSEPGPFARMVVRYVLMALTVCATVVVYLYILKIVILWEIPSNEIFSILSALFCLGMPVWVMAGYEEEGTFYSRVIAAMPYIFAPLICLQAYSMGIRIWQYGMTTNRYLGMMLIVFEIGTLLIWHFFKGKREKILLFFCLLVVVSVYIPGINMYSLSDSWQLFYLKKYSQAAGEGKELSDLEYERLAGSWKYLSKQESTKDIAAAYDISNIEMVEEMAKQYGDEIGLTKYDTHYVHCCQLVGSLDIGSYRKMSMLNQDSRYDEMREEGTEVDFSNFQFIDRGTGEAVAADIGDFAKRCMDYEIKHPDADKEEMSNAVKPYNKIPLEDGRVLMMNHFQVTYEEGVKNGKEYFSWKDIELGAILFEK